jgi:hypothetical protein
MIKIRQGKYAKFKSIEFELIVNENSISLIFRGNSSAEIEKLGFKKYAENVYTLDLNHNQIDAAVKVTTYCTYKGYRHYLETDLLNGLYRIRPLQEAQNYFNDYARHGYDPVYEAAESELEEIWEERTPVEPFKFDVESIFYLKKKEV